MCIRDRNIGHDMVDNMSKNKNLDYHFVTENEAQKGIEDGDYYMVITFPENLSSNAASLLTNDPKKLEISYQTTAGHSFVSSKMSDSAMSKSVSYTHLDVYKRQQLVCQKMFKKS